MKDTINKLISNKTARKAGLFSLGVILLAVFLLLSHRYSDITRQLWKSDKERSEGYMSVIQNQGQWPDKVLYRLRMNSAQVDFHSDGLHMVMAHQKDLDARHEAHHHPERNVHFEGIRFHGIRWTLEGSNPDVRIVGSKPHRHYFNYFKGNDPARWASKVPAYRELRYRDIYDGIDLIFYEKNGRLKYDFVIMPGADPGQIKMRIDHADRLRLAKDQLVIHTSVLDLVKQSPYTFQTDGDGSNKEIDCRYSLVGDVIGFEFPQGYQRDRELVIDPELIFSSYSGATDDNWGNTATFASDGSLYAGSSAFGDYPIVEGAFQSVNAGGSTDMAISKFTPDGSSLIYSTFIGGEGTEVPHSMIENSRGELVIFGTTSSSDYPVTFSAYDGSFAGGDFELLAGSVRYGEGSDMVVTVLNATGSALTGSSYMGGSRNDGLIDWENIATTGNYGDWFRGEVVVDEDDNIFVASTTYSTDIPTLNAFDSDLNDNSLGRSDGFLFSMNRTCSVLRFATYLGGTAWDACTSLKISGNGNIYTSGMTNSQNFPTTPGVIRENNSNGLSDAFAAQITNTGETLVAATYLGTNQEDLGYFIDFDEDGRLYVLGQCTASDYPITSGVYSNPGSANFIHSISPDLTNTIFSTQVGNGNGASGRLVVSAFLVDNCKRIYISGWGGQTNGLPSMAGMPLSSDAFQSVTDGSDFYLMVLEEEAQGLEYGSYFGGSTSNEHVDGGTSRFSREGAVYQAVCAGCGGNSDFPTSPGVVSAENGSSNCNLGVFKFEFDFSFINIQAIADPDRQGCAPMTVDFLNFTTGEASFLWDFDDGNTSSERSPTHTFEDVGVYEVVLIAEGLQECVIGDTATIIVEVLPQLENTVDSFDFCGELDTMLVASQTGPFVDYNWSTGSTDSFIIVDTSGIYWVETDGNNGCLQRDSFLVEINPIRTRNYDIEICEGRDTVLSSSAVSADATYLWQDSSMNATFFVDRTGRYIVETIREGECPIVDIFDVVITPPVPNLLDTSICEGDIITIGSSVIQGGLTYTWNDNLSDPTRDVGSEGTFVIRTTGVDFCTVVDSFVISYADTFRTRRTIGLCEGLDTLLSSSVSNAVFWSWNTGQNGQFITVDAPGQYTVIAQEGNCLFLNVFDVVQEAIRFEVDKRNIGCELQPSGVIDITTISGLEPLSYSIDGVNFVSSTRFEGLSAGSYTVTGRDTFGCSYSIDVSIDTPAIVDVDLTADLEIRLGEMTTLIATIDIPIEFVDSIQWTPAELGCTPVAESCLVREVMPVVDAQYAIEVTTVDGCKDIAAVAIEVIFERNVYVPNVFSPNGDGINDLFNLFAEEEIIQNIHGFQVFDRWGSLVYDAANFIPNDISRGWDGTYKGEPLNPAVFIWQADIEFINGVREVFSGDVTLIK